MDNFILNNDSWLRYLPIIICGLVIVLVIILIIIAFLIYRKHKNQSPKSHKKKTPFAETYADYLAANATSSAPLERNTMLKPEIAPIHVQQPATPIPDRPKSVNDSGVIEFYFDYEDEYKI